MHNGEERISKMYFISNVPMIHISHYHIMSHYKFIISLSG
jgi:hypothetical protein